MHLLEITYDLNRPGQNYTALYEGIKQLSSRWLHPMESVWFIETTRTTAQARDYLKQFVDANDKIFVARITDAAWTSFGANGDAFIQQVAAARV